MLTFLYRRAPNARGEPRRQPERGTSGGCWRRLQCVVRGRMRTASRLQPRLPSAGPLRATATPQRGPPSAPRRGLHPPTPAGTATTDREAATAPGGGEGMTGGRVGPQRPPAPRSTPRPATAVARRWRTARHGPRLPRVGAWGVRPLERPALRRPPRLGPQRPCRVGKPGHGPPATPGVAHEPAGRSHWARSTPGGGDVPRYPTPTGGSVWPWHRVPTRTAAHPCGVWPWERAGDLRPHRASDGMATGARQRPAPLREGHDGV